MSLTIKQAKKLVGEFVCLRPGDDAVVYVLVALQGSVAVLKYPSSRNQSAPAYLDCSVINGKATREQLANFVRSQTLTINFSPVE